MTTSPSWFDQEKFSRLVKKVGSKNTPATPVPGAIAKINSVPVIKVGNRLPTIKTPPPEATPRTAPASSAISGEAQVARDRSVTGPLPAIKMPVVTTTKTTPLSSKRSTMIKSSPLPGLKPVFAYDKPEPAPQEVPQALPNPETPASPMEENISAKDSEELASLREELAAALKKLQSLEGESSQANQNLEQVRNENTVLREQLRQAEEAGKDREILSAQIDELSIAAQERDQARDEVAMLREQLRQAEEAGKDREALAEQIGELSNAAQERDQARREYSQLREQFEILKQENARMGEKKIHSEESQTASQEQVEQLNQQLVEREEEISQLKVNIVGFEDVIETLRQELNTLQEQVHQARDEATAAQSGLILNQKALQETRDALREASVGSSMSKANLENLKNECSTLVQQNMLLQAQHDQLSRDLSAAKAKLAARGG